MDIAIEPNGLYDQTIPLKWNSLCFVYEGSGRFCDKDAGKNDVIVI